MRFEKYHGLGNDFVIVNEKDAQGQDYNGLAIRICDRKVGVGADGLIVASDYEGMPWMKFYNADGTPDSMCGNGIRCFAYYLKNNNLAEGNKFLVYTDAGIMKIETSEEGAFLVKVNMGKPSFKPESIPAKSEKEIFNERIDIEGVEYKYSSLFMGTPHTVVFVDESTDRIAEKLGPVFNNKELYPEETSVNFVEVISKNLIKIKTYERGVGLTLACGTGSCSSVVVGNRMGMLDEKVTVIHKLGNLEIELENDVFMTGPAVKVAEGIYLG